jgi:hypothetical protein
MCKQSDERVEYGCRCKNINLMFPSALANGLQADITIGQVNALSFTPSQ